MEGKYQEIAAAVQAGLESAQIEERCSYVEPTSAVEGDPARPGYPVVLLNAGQTARVLTEVIELADKRAPAPARRRGTSRHRELDSFTGHVKRYADDNDSVIWADPGAFTVTAVFNYNPPGTNNGDAGWGDHRAIYEAPRSEPWQAWTKNDGKAMRQVEFAEWIDSRMADIIVGDGYPKPINLLELARDLQIHTKGAYEKKIDPTSGQYAMVCKLEHAESSTKIPKAFLLALPVFEGGASYRVEARIRFAMVDNAPSFAYVLYQRAEIERAAFADVRKVVAEATGLPVFVGTPEGDR